jgi:hypothetical protein
LVLVGTGGLPFVVKRSMLWVPRSFRRFCYEGIYNLNRAFHATLLCFERLENLGFFRAEYLNAYKIELEHTRADANEELMEVLQEHEQDEGARFEQMRKEWEKQWKDPDDVFFAARHRKEEIQEQIKNLQRGLDRLKPQRQNKKSRRSKRSTRSTQSTKSTH